MALKTTHAAALCAVLLAGGCSFAEEALFPSTGTVETAAAAPAGAPPALGTSNFEPPGVTAGAPTGTFVGQKVSTLRGDLGQLQGMLGRHNQGLQMIRTDTVQDSQRYHGTVAAINARLQVGTTPGNPILNQQWNAAQGELDRINEDVLKMTRLANEVTNSSALAAYLLESVRAARQLSGAVDEDHRQLRILEDETNRTVVLVERLLTELSEDINRQQSYVANERQNLNTLALAIKNGQLYGSSFSGARAPMMAPSSFDAQPMGGMGLSPVAADAPLVTIRFDKPNVSYESALYAAVKSALDRRPAAAFDVIAVSPTGSTPGAQALGASNVRRNAEQVVRSLTNMGLPANRIRVSQTTSGMTRSGEVQVFVR
ncbi:hypothetical protein [Magnetospirillum sp. UT-4]|uniref:hypothetical protein n=1 Tax=Magnetospirillum sp. UT-4 TaxID=2681467 RepID=UPI00137CC18E|nr:hypothetical protein [Magnetospirillum sp. UT-4]CAA7617231.1 Magnetosome membrane associated protein MmeA [Magnetospirillum sp. UT-4]